MKTNDIDAALRKAPQPQPPAGLVDKLKQDIRLPEQRSEETLSLIPAWRRWIPALGFAVVILSCAVVLAVQTIQINTLKQANASLRESVAGLEDLRQANAQSAEAEKLRQELNRLQGEHAETQRLRDEIQRLRQQVQNLANLREENQRLRQAQATASKGGVVTIQDEEFFNRQKEKAKSIVCINNLKQIGLAARIWANENGDVLPKDWLAMKKPLNTPKILWCAADTVRTKANDWAGFSPANTSYEILAPGVGYEQPRMVYARCLIHGHVVLVDGSAHQDVMRSDKNAVIESNGFFILK